jgi:hypothetical protein
MAAADDEGHDQRWNENNEFNNRNPTPGVESHDDCGILNVILVVENALLGRFLCWIKSSRVCVEFTLKYIWHIQRKPFNLPHKPKYGPPVHHRYQVQEF